MTIPEMGFYNEVERQAAIDAVVQDIRAYPQPTIDSDILVKILHKHRLQIGELSMDEVHYITTHIK